MSIGYTWYGGGERPGGNAIESETWPFVLVELVAVSDGDDADAPCAWDP